MSFSFAWLRISLSLILLCVIFFFFNRRPKFILPVTYLKQKLRYLHIILLGILLLSIILLPLSLSFVSERKVVVEKDIPIQIILDVSLSMAANDMHPSRFAAAKNSLISLVKNLDGYYLSLIAFSGKPFVYVPFSSSSSAIAKKLAAMNLWDFPPVPDFLWTAIGDALLLGVSNLQQFSHQETYKPWVVILITDGDSNIGFDPLQVISYYQKTSVPLYVLGVGQENYLIWRDVRGSEVTTDINLSLLQQLAQKTWWWFSRILGTWSFDTFFSGFLQNIVEHQQQRIEPIFRNLNDYLLYVISLLLIWLFFFRIYVILHKR